MSDEDKAKEPGGRIELAKGETRVRVTTENHAAYLESRGFGRVDPEPERPGAGRPRPSETKGV